MGGRAARGGSGGMGGGSRVYGGGRGVDRRRHHGVRRKGVVGGRWRHGVVDRRGHRLGHRVVRRGLLDRWHRVGRHHAVVVPAAGRQQQRRGRQGKKGVFQIGRESCRERVCPEG